MDEYEEMNPQDIKDEITALDIRLNRLKILLAQSLRTNELFDKLHIISEDMRVVSNRIKELKKLIELINYVK